MDDPSVYVRFPLVDEPDNSLLVWTTTPWTLPSNQFAAVHPELDYSVVEIADGQKLILASALVEAVTSKVESDPPPRVVRTMKGADLIGKRYVPPFDYYHKADGEKQGALRSSK